MNWAPYWHPTQPYVIWTGADHSDPTARPNYDLWLLRYETVDGRPQPVGEPIRVTDQSGGRRVAGLFARRQATDVDQQPDRRPLQPVVAGRFQVAEVRGSGRRRAEGQEDSHAADISEHSDRA